MPTWPLGCAQEGTARIRPTTSRKPAMTNTDTVFTAMHVALALITYPGLVWIKPAFCIDRSPSDNTSNH